MALPVFQIGPFRMFSLSAPPQTPSEMAEVIQRPGVDGTGFMRTGRKGEEFELTSSIDVADKYTAHAIAAGYHSLENQAIYNIIYSDVDYSIAGVGFVVRKVSVDRINLLRRSVGGVNAGLAFLTARWRLMPVIIS